MLSRWGFGEVCFAEVDDGNPFPRLGMHLAIYLWRTSSFFD